MAKLQTKTKQHTPNRLLLDTFRNEDGAIDLSSIMVGIIVIGLIGGVISATVFAVIPWTQDNAAKQQLDSVVAAQSSYMGLASSVPPGTPAGHTPNSYADSTKLEEAKLMSKGKNYCTVVTDGGKGYEAYSYSNTGQIWSVSDKNTKAVIFAGTLPTDCQFILPPDAPYVDSTPKLTSLTFQCNTTTTSVLPMKTNLTGTAEWSDGSSQTYSGAATSASKTLNAGQTYTVKFTGTYQSFSGWSTLNSCLTSVDHWGSETGVTTADSAFFQANKLVNVPRHIPQTITNMSGMFNQASTFNDPDISDWKTTNVTNMSNMFNMANAFNQPLDRWDTSNVTVMNGMFAEARAFNQPLNNWNTAKVTNMFAMFMSANAFNQPLDKWDTSKVTNMYGMFQGATKFNQPIGNWNIGNVNDIRSMFSSSAFNQPLNDWNTSKVTNMSWAFSGTPFNQPLDKWQTGLVTNMSNMFYISPEFNQPIGNWNTANVTNMAEMFQGATKFNQPLNEWNTSKVTTMHRLFQETSFNQPLDKWQTGLVTDMAYMFNKNTEFNQPIGNWNTANVTTINSMFSEATKFNQPLNEWSTLNITNMSSAFSYTPYSHPLDKWVTSKVTNMSYMFWGVRTYTHNLSGWNTIALTNGNYFAQAAYFQSAYKPSGTTLV